LRAIADDLPIDEDRHVLAQRRLVVEHIAPRLRDLRENVLQNLS
jgi:hypothetical protein